MERRQHPRYPMHVGIEIQAGAQTVTSTAGHGDLSFGGMWAGGVVLPVDTIVEVRLLLKDLLKLTWQVRRSVPGRGCGIEFRYVTREQAQALADLMRRLEAFESRHPTFQR